VLGQLGNRVQHALRAFTPDDATALKKTVKTYPRSDAYDIGETLTSLGTGEAIVTVLSERGAPTPVAWTMLRAPRSFMGAVEPTQLAAAVAASPLLATYGTPVDRDSAYERLAARLAPPPAPATPPPSAPAPAERPDRDTDTEAPPRARRGREPEPEPGMVEQVLGSSAFRAFTRSAASALGREITRGIFGTRRRR
jgi:hypothetical protein